VTAVGHDVHLEGPVAGPPPRVTCGPRKVHQMAHRHDGVVRAVRQEHRPAIARDRGTGADRVNAMPARSQVDARRQPCERVGDRIGQGEPGEPEGLARQAIRIARRRDTDERQGPGVRGRCEDRATASDGVAEDAGTGHLGASREHVERS